MDLTIIDWTHIENLPESICICLACDTLFNSHAKFVCQDQEVGIVSKKPCPKCKTHVLAQTRSDWEQQTISRG